MLRNDAGACGVQLRLRLRRRCGMRRSCARRLAESLSADCCSRANGHDVQAGAVAITDPA